MKFSVKLENAWECAPRAPRSSSIFFIVLTFVMIRTGVVNSQFTTQFKQEKFNHVTQLFA